jgi:hypothetical protein
MEDGSMKPWLKIIAYISIVSLLIGLYFFDNIRGYYRFKELCAEHKEVVVYEKLQPNVGWQDNLKEYENFDSVNEKLYFMPKIKFYRFNDYTKRQLYDASFVGVSRLPWERFDAHARSNEEMEEIKDPRKYEHSTADLKNAVVYQLENFSEPIVGETRMSRGGYRIRDLRTNKIVISLEEIGYSTFDRNHTLLDAPSGNICRFAPSFYSTNIQNQMFAN